MHTTEKVNVLVTLARRQLDHRKRIVEQMESAHAGHNLKCCATLQVCAAEREFIALDEQTLDAIGSE